MLQFNMLLLNLNFVKFKVILDLDLDPQLFIFLK